MPKTLNVIGTDKNTVRALVVEESGSVALYGRAGVLGQTHIQDFQAIEWADGYLDQFLRPPAGSIGAGLSIGIVSQVIAYFTTGTNLTRIIAACAGAAALAYWFTPVKIKFTQADGNQFVVNANQPALRFLRRLRPGILA